MAGDLIRMALMDRWTCPKCIYIWKAVTVFTTSERDAKPRTRSRWILLDESEEASIRLLLARALNKNQVLILRYALSCPNKTISTLLRRISAAEQIPLSTLKLNAQILRELRLLSYNDYTVCVSALAEKLLPLLYDA